MWNIHTSVLFSLLILSTRAEKIELNIMGLFSITGENWPGGGACLTAAEMALRHVNARDDLFPKFRLNLIWRDGKVGTFELVI